MIPMIDDFKQRFTLGDNFVVVANSEHETCSTDLCIAKHAAGYSTDSNTARERREQVWIARQQREW